MMFKKIFIISFLSTMLLAFKFDYKSFETDFIQYINDGQNMIDYQGKIYYQDNKSLWIYTKPDEKKVYINNNEIVIIDDELEQVIQSDENLDLKEILKHVKEVSPSVYEANYENIHYIIKTNDYFLDTIEYKDELDNKVKIVFSNSKVNNKINNNLFKYDIPKNYDIIKR